MSRPDLRSAEAPEIAAGWRVAELCLPSHESAGAASFRPRGAETLDADWDAWVAEVFAPAITLSLISLREAAEAQSVGALLAADAGLGAGLPAAAAAGSLAAGRRALLDFVPPRGARLLERLREAAAANKAAGHMATVFAVRAHIFHLPSVQVSGALLLAECVLGAGSVGVTLPAARAAGMLRRATAAPACAPGWSLAAV